MRSVVCLVWLVLLSTPERGVAEPPAQDVLAREVQRLLGPGVTPDHCRVVRETRGETILECTTTRCGPACQVTHVITTLSFRRGRARRVASREERRGDTGECGCCL